MSLHWGDGMLDLDGGASADAEPADEDAARALEAEFAV